MPEPVNPREQPVPGQPGQHGPSFGNAPWAGLPAPGGQNVSGQPPANGHGDVPGWAAPQSRPSFMGQSAPAAPRYPGDQSLPAAGFASQAPAAEPGSSGFMNQPGLAQPGGHWGAPGSTPVSAATPGPHGVPPGSFPGVQGHAPQGFPPSGAQPPGASGVPFAPAPVKRGPVKRWALIASIASGCLVLVLAITAVLMSTAPARAERIPDAIRSNAAEGPSHPDPIPFAKVALRELPGVVLSADGWNPAGQLPSEDDDGYEGLWFQGDGENCYVLVSVKTGFEASDLDDRTATEAYVRDMMNRSQSVLERPAVREQAIAGGGSFEMIDFRAMLPEGTDALVSARVFVGSGHAMVILGTCKDGSDPSAMVREFREKASITILPS